MIQIKYNKTFLKRLSLLTCFIIVFTLIKTQGFIANAASKPQFTVSIDAYKPSNPKVGDEITVNGTIHPQDFEIPITAKEIILILDTSGSMANPKTGNVNDSKIEKLKIAAENFVDKMKNEPNLKIGIVTFSTASTIQSELTPANQSDDLKNVIKSLNADGGTNTGEGLRRAAYLLSSSSNSTANKTVVFMSDGIPTYYNWQSTGGWQLGNYNGEYYKYYKYRDSDFLHIFNMVYMGKYSSDEGYVPSSYSRREGPYRGDYQGYKYQEEYNGYVKDITKSDISSDFGVTTEGTGSSDDDGSCLDYAKTIGKIIKDKGYNAYSISYGLTDDDGNSKMQQIHNSMSLNNSNFFITDTDAIDKVFSNIADNILGDYPITNVNFNFDSNANTNIESIDGTTIKLPNFDYKKVAETSTTIKYSAPAIPFSLKIKSNIAGENIPIFENSTVTFPWKKDLIIANVPVKNITVNNNSIPNIKATLETPTITANSTQEIDVKYKIDTDPFEYNISNSNGGIDEAVFVVNLTNNMKDANGHRYTNLKNSFNESILDGTILGDRDIKFNAVGYNESVKYPTDNDDNALFGRKSERENLRLVFENEINVDHTDNDIKLDTANNNRNIEQALNRANKLLEEKGDADKNKAMILVTSGDANYDANSDIIKTISQKGYKIISLDMSNTDGSQNVNLKNLHHLLSGNDNDYIVAQSDGGQYNQPEKFYMDDIARKLLQGTQPTTLSINNVKLNFDLGDNFDAVENGKLEGSGKTRTITIPHINYTLTKDNESEKYLWRQTEPQPLEIDFSIKPAIGKYGTLGFGPPEKNTISYDYLGGGLANKNIETPIITISGVKYVEHGLYKGMDTNNGKAIIDETEKTFPMGSAIPMAAFINGATNGVVTLEIAHGIQIDGDINVYKIDDSGIIKPAIGQMQFDGEKYSYNMSNLSDSGEKILILYNEKLPRDNSANNNNSEYINHLWVQGTDYPGKIKVAGDLPDLF